MKLRFKETHQACKRNTTCTDPMWESNPQPWRPQCQPLAHHAPQYVTINWSLWCVRIFVFINFLPNSVIPNSKYHQGAAENSKESSFESLPLFLVIAHRCPQLACVTMIDERMRLWIFPRAQPICSKQFLATAAPHGIRTHNVWIKRRKIYIININQLISHMIQSSENLDLLL